VNFSGMDAKRSSLVKALGPVAKLNLLQRNDASFETSCESEDRSESVSIVTPFFFFFFFFFFSATLVLYEKFFKNVKTAGGWCFVWVPQRFWPFCCNSSGSVDHPIGNAVPRSRGNPPEWCTFFPNRGRRNECLVTSAPKSALHLSYFVVIVEFSRRLRSWRANATPAIPSRESVSTVLIIRAFWENL